MLCFSNRKFLWCLFCIVFSRSVFAQLPRNGLDVKHYRFSISLNDSNNVIRGDAMITTSFIHDEKQVVFDLADKNLDGKGMVVSEVQKNGHTLFFEQKNQKLIIEDQGRPGSAVTYRIKYSGIPSDGLIISNNKYGERVFFADNWPNRAHNWIPCNDHLSDKATVEFLVTAPDHYQVISNGKKVEESKIGNHLKLTWWKESALLPTKVMVIGAARFAIASVGEVDNIPVSAWVYPQDRDSGFAHYAIAKNILKWYIGGIGPYAFEKLANVQSKTIFGGMENASCIFYFENSVESKGIESLMAHEIAHQWFGDNVTEKDWPHLWLSEGFATYMTDLYLESKYGTDSMRGLLKKDRRTVIAFSKKYAAPVVDTSASDDLMKLLNANSYQKGSWVLHMLRRKVGDSSFWKSIRIYYKKFYGRNASTSDLKKVFEKVSHQNLDTFFDQWLYTPGQPELHIDWQYNKLKKTVDISINQEQQQLFHFPVTILFSNGEKRFTKSFNITDKKENFSIPVSFEPLKMTVDPDVNLLFELQ